MAWLLGFAPLSFGNIGFVGFCHSEQSTFLHMETARHRYICKIQPHMQHLLYLKVVVENTPTPWEKPRHIQFNDWMLSFSGDWLQSWNKMNVNSLKKLKHLLIHWVRVFCLSVALSPFPNWARLNPFLHNRGHKPILMLATVCTQVS